MSLPITILIHNFFIQTIEEPIFKNKSCRCLIKLTWFTFLKFEYEVFGRRKVFRV